MNPKAPVLGICGSHEFARVHVEGGRTGSVSRSTQILTSDDSPEISCTSWPIWDWGLAHCLSPEPLFLGNKILRSSWVDLPWWFLVFLLWNSSGFGFCLHGSQRSPLLSSHLDLAYHTCHMKFKNYYIWSYSVEKLDAEEFIKYPTFYVKRGR